MSRSGIGSGVHGSFLTLLLAVAASCSAVQSTANSAWSLQLTTSGGFAGIGTGNLSLTSDGKFKYQPAAPPRSPRMPCVGKLSTEELQPISEAVAQSQPKEWNRPGLNVAAPDAYGYKLELRRGDDKQALTAQWYDNTRDQLPADLKKLSEALMQLMEMTAKKCPN
jgi:hypothetical protein